MKKFFSFCLKRIRKNLPAAGVIGLLIIAMLYAGKNASEKRNAAESDKGFSIADITIFSSIRDNTGAKPEYTDKEDDSAEVSNVANQKKYEIRVLISKDGAYIHNNVTVTGNTEIFVYMDDETEPLHLKKGEVLNLNQLAEETSFDRVTVVAENGKITVSSVEKGDGAPAYRGKLCIEKKSGGYVVVNEIDLEEYLYAVVSSEMPSSYEKEALKAQAVCARSYAVRNMQAGAFQEYGADLDDTTSSQVYNNIPETESTIEAVNETAGMIMSSEGEIVNAYFFSTSCGTTCRNDDVWNGEKLPYLNDQLEAYGEADKKRLADTPVMLESGYFQVADGKLSTEEVFRDFIDNKIYVNSIEKDEPLYRWTISYDAQQMEDTVYREIQNMVLSGSGDVTFYNKEGAETDASGAVQQNGVSETLGSLQDIRISNRGNSGIAQDVLIYGKQASVRISGQMAIRQLFHPADVSIEKQDGSSLSGWTMLPSAYFYIKKDEDGNYVLRGGGFGHGVGMSQNGANALAAAGYDYRAILTHYYNGVVIENLNQMGYNANEE